MKKEILIVLGSPNSPNGELSTISKSRLDFCANIYEEGNLILCTGGWGEHFNTSSRAHAVYAKNFLIKKGCLETDFLSAALSQNTVDDAIKIKEILSKIDKLKLAVITSDYHLDRVQLIFSEILNKFKIRYLGVKSNLVKIQLQHLIKHEKNAKLSILNNGLYY